MSFSVRDLQEGVYRANALRSTLSRRRFIGLAAGGAAAMTFLPKVPVAASPNRDPKPIPGGMGPFRAWAPAYMPGGPPAVFEQSTIGDFSGGIASTDVTGWGTDNSGRELYFRCDMRAQKGRYVAVDGNTYEGAFAFI